MKTSTDHLPNGKRQELQRVLEVLFREFDEATKRKSSKRGQGRILKAILFGSYARGDWVDDPVGGYKSDYDLLIVVNHDEFTEVTDYWMDAEARLEQAFDIAHTLTAPAHFIVHSLADVNRQLTRGRPFFTEIVKEGVVLFEAADHPLAWPAKLSPEEAHREAKANFDRWFPSAVQYLETGEDHLSKGPSWFNKGAFELHQAAERFYHCTLLTETLYSTKSHNLNFLRGQAERVAPELIPPGREAIASKSAAGSCCDAPMSRRASRTRDHGRTAGLAGGAGHRPAAAGRGQLPSLSGQYCAEGLISVLGHVLDSRRRPRMVLRRRRMVGGARGL